MAGQTDFYAGVVGAAIIAVAIAVVFATICRVALSVARRFGYRSVFAAALLQAPGDRLRRRLESQRDLARIYSAALVAMPLVFFALLLAWPSELEASLNDLRWLLMSSVAAAVVAYLCVALARLVMDKAATRYELAADIAVSHALERVMQRNFSVFHDVRVDTVTVDKVVVGRKGVLALSVFAHPRRRLDQRHDASAQFDGKQLVFPDGTTHAPEGRARAQANALSRHLSRRLGKQIDVCPVLVVPGWPLVCTAQPAFPVVNERNIEMVSEWTRPDAWLLDEDVEELQTYLTGRCCEGHHVS